MGTRIYLCCFACAVLIWWRAGDEAPQDPPADAAFGASLPSPEAHAAATPPLPPPTVPEPGFEPPEEPANASFASIADASEWRTFQETHMSTVREFLSNPGFGVARMIDAPVLESWKVAEETYYVSRYVLIGRETARAYRAGLRGHDKKKRKEWRKLTSLEVDAVARLEGGDEIIVDGDHGILFGALRAQQSCLECHDVEAGDLLGAFRYFVVPRGPDPLNLVPREYQPPERD